MIISVNYYTLLFRRYFRAFKLAISRPKVSNSQGNLFVCNCEISMKHGWEEADTRPEESGAIYSGYKSEAPFKIEF